MMYNGLRVFQDPNCLKETEERLFPASRHRSARVRKKLIKRHGGEFRLAPTAYVFPDRMVCHPAIYQNLKAMIKMQFNAEY